MDAPLSLAALHADVHRACTLALSALSEEMGHGGDEKALRAAHAGITKAQERETSPPSTLAALGRSALFRAGIRARRVLQVEHQAWSDPPAHIEEAFLALAQVEVQHLSLTLETQASKPAQARPRHRF